MEGVNHPAALRVINPKISQHIHQPSEGQCKRAGYRLFPADEPTPPASPEHQGDSSPSRIVDPQLSISLLLEDIARLTAPRDNVRDITAKYQKRRRGSSGLRPMSTLPEQPSPTVPIRYSVLPRYADETLHTRSNSAPGDFLRDSQVLPRQDVNTDVATRPHLFSRQTDSQSSITKGLGLSIATSASTNQLRRQLSGARSKPRPNLTIDVKKKKDTPPPPPPKSPRHGAPSQGDKHTRIDSRNATHSHSRTVSPVSSIASLTSPQRDSSEGETKEVATRNAMTVAMVHTQPPKIIHHGRTDSISPIPSVEPSIPDAEAEETNNGLVKGSTVSVVSRTPILNRSPVSNTATNEIQKSRDTNATEAPIHAARSEQPLSISDPPNAGQMHNKQIAVAVGDEPFGPSDSSETRPRCVQSDGETRLGVTSPSNSTSLGALKYARPNLDKPMPNLPPPSSRFSAHMRKLTGDNAVAKVYPPMPEALNSQPQKLAQGSGPGVKAVSKPPISESRTVRCPEPSSRPQVNAEQNSQGSAHHAFAHPTISTMKSKSTPDLRRESDGNSSKARQGPTLSPFPPPLTFRGRYHTKVDAEEAGSEGARSAHSQQACNPTLVASRSPSPIPAPTIESSRDAGASPDYSPSLADILSRSQSRLASPRVGDRGDASRPSSPASGLRTIPGTGVATVSLGQRSADPLEPQRRSRSPFLPDTAPISAKDADASVKAEGSSMSPAATAIQAVEAKSNEVESPGSQNYEEPTLRPSKQAHNTTNAEKPSAVNKFKSALQGVRSTIFDAANKSQAHPVLNRAGDSRALTPMQDEAQPASDLRPRPAPSARPAAEPQLHSVATVPGQEIGKRSTSPQEVERIARPILRPLVPPGMTALSSIPDPIAKLQTDRTAAISDPLERLQALSQESESLHARYAGMRRNRLKLSTAISVCLKTQKPGPDYTNTLLDQYLALNATNSALDICFAKLKSLDCKKEEAIQEFIAQSKLKQCDNCKSSPTGDATPASTALEEWLSVDCAAEQKAAISVKEVRLQEVAERSTRAQNMIAKQNSHLTERSEEKKSAGPVSARAVQNKVPEDTSVISEPQADRKTREGATAAQLPKLDTNHPVIAPLEDVSPLDRIFIDLDKELFADLRFEPSLDFARLKGAAGDGQDTVRDAKGRQEKRNTVIKRNSSSPVHNRTARRPTELSPVSPLEDMAMLPTGLQLRSTKQDMSPEGTEGRHASTSRRLAKQSQANGAEAPIQRRVQVPPRKPVNATPPSGQAPSPPQRVRQATGDSVSSMASSSQTDSSPDPEVRTPRGSQESARRRVRTPEKGGLHTVQVFVDDDILDYYKSAR